MITDEDASEELLEFLLLRAHPIARSTLSCVHFAAQNNARRQLSVSLRIVRKHQYYAYVARDRDVLCLAHPGMSVIIPIWKTRIGLGDLDRYRFPRVEGHHRL